MYVNQLYLINIIFTGDAIQPILRALADESGKNTFIFSPNWKRQKVTFSYLSFIQAVSVSKPLILWNTLKRTILLLGKR